MLHGDRSETGDIIYLNFFSWRNFAMNKSWKLNWSDWWDYLCDQKKTRLSRPNPKLPVATALDNAIVDWTRAGGKSLIFVRLEHWTIWHEMALQLQEKVWGHTLLQNVPSFTATCVDDNLQSVSKETIPAQVPILTSAFVLWSTCITFILLVTSSS